MSSIRLLIAEDHAITREGIVAIFNRIPDFTVVAEAENGEQAVILYRQHQPHIALIDLRMPKLDGVGTITQIRQEFPTACLIVLTTYDTDEDIYRGLSAGAKGYLLKDTTAAELVKAVRTVYSGRKYIPPDIAVKLFDRLNSNELTDRELEVLHLVTKGKSNAEIGVLLAISEGTVKFHITNLLAKLGVKDRTQAIIIALQRGLVCLDKPS
jgi:two-component system, NarL family, response regulator